MYYFLFYFFSGINKCCCCCCGSSSLNQASRAFLPSAVYLRTLGKSTLGSSKEASEGTSAHISPGEGKSSLSSLSVVRSAEVPGASSKMKFSADLLR